jgi:hypothetical protein
MIGMSKMLRDVLKTEYGLNVVVDPKTFEIKYIKEKEQTMTNLKKYLNAFYWYDETPESLLTRIPLMKTNPDYPDTFALYFGLAPTSHLKISKKSLPVENRGKFEMYLMSLGFDIVDVTGSSYKFIHLTKGIIINGDYSVPPSKDDDDDDDEYRVTIRNGDENVFITILPTKCNRDFIEEVITYITKKFLKSSSVEIDKFYMIAQNQRGLFTQKTKFKSIPIKDDRFDIFYGKNFPHETLLKFVHEETDNLLLLHGDPGTGKSNYIKHIITNSAKKVIYIPPSMLTVISSPDFVTFVMENKNSIILIEDAEEILTSDRNAATNNLLGLTDGFLKDALNLKIICTFNCDLKKIDDALMRKGRMYFQYKFDKLTIDECDDLADFMGLDRKVKEPSTLAEFFNIEDNSIENSFEQRRIGFV